MQSGRRTAYSPHKIQCEVAMHWTVLSEIWYNVVDNSGMPLNRAWFRIRIAECFYFLCHSVQYSTMQSYLYSAIVLAASRLRGAWSRDWFCEISLVRINKCHFQLSFETTYTVSFHIMKSKRSAPLHTMPDCQSQSMRMVRQSVEPNLQGC